MSQSARGLFFRLFWKCSIFSYGNEGGNAPKTAYCCITAPPEKLSTTPELDFLQGNWCFVGLAVYFSLYHTSNGSLSTQNYWKIYYLFLCDACFVSGMILCMQVVLETSLIPHKARILRTCVSCTVVMWMAQNHRMASVGRQLWSKEGGPAEPSPEQQPLVPQPAHVHCLFQPPSSSRCLLDCIRVSSCCCWVWWKLDVLVQLRSQECWIKVNVTS